MLEGAPAPSSFETLGFAKLFRMRGG